MESSKIMVRVILIAGLLITCGSTWRLQAALSAADAPVLHAASGQSVVYTTNKDTQGLSIDIRNTGRAAITALLVSVQRRDSAGVLRSDSYRYIDVYVNRGTDAPLLSGGAIKLLLLPAEAEMPGSRYDVVFRGALFADGSSFGDQVAVDILSGRRRRVVEELSKAEAIVLRATKEAWSHTVLTGHIRDLLDHAKTPVASAPSSGTTSAINMMEPFILTWLLNSMDSVDSSCQTCMAERIRSTGRDLVRWRNELSGTFVSQ